MSGNNDTTGAERQPVSESRKDASVVSPEAMRKRKQRAKDPDRYREYMRNYMREYRQRVK